MSTHTATTSFLGTPCARSWSQEWIATVEAEETKLGKRICGARLRDGSPCTNEPQHTNGRCRFHGGFDLTGAPKGNRNSVIHGIYSRRLRTCGPTCPFWQSCPCAGPDVAALPPTKAPLCPYQLTEYNTVLTDALALVESQPHPNPMGIHIAHNVAILQVLIGSAAATLTNVAQASRLHSSESSDDTPASEQPNPNATNAFLRLLREFRTSMRLLQPPLSRQKNNATPPCPHGINRHAERTQCDTDLDPDSLLDSQIPDQPKPAHTLAYVQQAIQAASQGRDIDMIEAFDQATQIDQELAETERDHVLASYRPVKQSVSDEMAKAILGNLHLPPLETEDHFKCPYDPKNCQMEIESAKIYADFLALMKEGKVPPETFPIGHPLRSYKPESIVPEPAPTT